MSAWISLLIPLNLIKRWGKRPPHKSVLKKDKLQNLLPLAFCQNHLILYIYIFAYSWVHGNGYSWTLGKLHMGLHPSRPENIWRLRYWQCQPDRMNVRPTSVYLVDIPKVKMFIFTIIAEIFGLVISLQSSHMRPSEENGWGNYLSKLI